MPKIIEPDYSKFDLSHLHRTSFDMGKLVPISMIKTVPGDYFKIDVDAFVRGMPTIAPIIDKVDIKINHFYVPYRVLWNKFGEFISMSKSNFQDAPQMPVMTMLSDKGSNYPNGRLADYLGIPSTIPAGSVVNAMPFLAYQSIYLNYYAPPRWVEYLNAHNPTHPLSFMKHLLEVIREGPGGINLTDNAITNNEKLMTIRNVGWNHDYFTNALPTPQLFDAVKIPLFNDEAELKGETRFETDGYVQQTTVPFQDGTHYGDYNDRIRATISDLRQSVALQHFLERMQYGGGRYIETMKVIWGQDIPDSTLQRPEYLGGDVIPLFVNEVEQTAETEFGKLGDVGGKPVGAGRFKNIEFQADEFGLYMAIAHVVPKRSYSDALDRLWFQKDVLDFPLPDFEGIGDQAVLGYELDGKGYADDPLATTNNIFGYVPRYSEYKGQLDRFSGELRTTLKHWHLGTTADDLTPYNEISPEFIECNPREDIFNVNEPDKLLGTFQINVDVNRKLSNNPLPGLARL